MQDDELLPSDDEAAGGSNPMAKFARDPSLKYVFTTAAGDAKNMARTADEDDEPNCTKARASVLAVVNTHDAIDILRVANAFSTSSATHRTSQNELLLYTNSATCFETNTLHKRGITPTRG